MISIIIPIWNCHDMTEECIMAIRQNTQDYELVIIDNGSDPEFSPPEEGWIDVSEFGIFERIYLGKIEGIGPITIIRNEDNKGFPVAVNQGIRAAKGDVIVLLNNDVIVTTGWADRFLDHLENYSIVAPVANYCAGLQQEATLPTYQSMEELFDVASEWSREHEGETREVNFVIGFCMAFRKSLFDEIGPFDETHWPCCGEEIDWCFRARVAGHKIAVAIDVYVHHIGSQTFHAMEAKGKVDYMHVCRRNDMHLEKKWGPNIWGRQTGSMACEIGPPPSNFPGSNHKVRLNLGCSTYTLPGFINVDQFEECHPDLVADVRKLPYEPETVDEIYAGHLLEHLDWEEGQEALRHWWTILKKGGEIRVTVPDFDVLAKRYLAKPTAEAMRFMNDWYIYSYVQKSHHRYLYGPALLKAALAEAGFGELEKVPMDHPYFTANVDDQISYKGVK